MNRIVVLYLDSDCYGGMEESILSLIRHLDRSRFMPVLTYHDGEELTPLVAGARALDTPMWRIPRMQGRHGMRPFLRFVSELKRLDPAVFHAHLNWPLACQYGLVAAKAARVPAVCATEHSMFDIPWPASMLLKRMVYRGVDRHIAVSQAAARRLTQTYGIRREEVDVVYNGVAPDRFSTSSAGALRTELTGGQDLAVLLSIGRVDSQKGHAYLLEAVQRIPAACLIIAGEGPERAALERRAQALGVSDRVRFLGFRTDVAELLASSDIVVQPSAEFDAFPLSPLEAMAAGRAVVVTDVGGLAEVVVHGESGLVVPPRNVDALVNALETLLENPSLRERMAAAGQRRVAECFTARRMADEVLSVYARVCASAGIA